MQKKKYHVYENKENGTWYFSVRISGEKFCRRRGLDDQPFLTEAEAIAGEKEFLAFNGAAKPKDYTFRMVFKLWMRHRAELWKETTLYNNRNYENHILNKFPRPDCKASELKQLHFQMWREEMDKVECKDRYKNDILNAFKAMWQYADDFLDLHIPFAKRLNRFKSYKPQKKRRKVIYTPAQFGLFMQGVDDARLYMLLMLAYSLGVRPGECLAVKIEDFHYENHSIELYKTSSNKLGTGKREDFITKNDSSDREINLAISICDLLLDFITRFHPTPNNSKSYIFYSTLRGSKAPISPTNLRVWVNRYSEKADLPHIQVRELMRTSYATFALQLPGVYPQTVQVSMGHNSLETTMNHYNQAWQENTAVLVKKVDETIVQNVSLQMPETAAKVVSHGINMVSEKKKSR